jgi:transposase
MEYVGIDVHKNQSQICLLTETGEVLHQRIHTQRERFREAQGGWHQ